jgi:hypothetical protein
MSVEGVNHSTEAILESRWSGGLQDIGNDLDSDLDSEPEGNMNTVSNMSCDIMDYEEKVIKHQLAFSGCTRLSCFSHTLQLVVRKFDELGSHKKAVGKAKTMSCQV